MIILSDLKKKIDSLKSTLKTIMVMKMSATADVKKIKGIYSSFFLNISEIMAIKTDLAKYISDCNNSNIINLFYKKQNQAGKKIIVYFSSDKGLCGGLNTKLVKLLDSDVYKNNDNIEIIAIGKKSTIQIPKVTSSKIKVHYISYEGKVFEDFDANNISKKIEEIMKQSYIKDIRFIFNRYINTIKQDQVDLSASDFEEFFSNSYSDQGESYTYATKIQSFSDHFLTVYLSYIIKYCILQNKLSESSMRMMAMDTAEDNCNDMITDMSTKYNKGRQEKITLELIDIISGMQ